MIKQQPPTNDSLRGTNGRMIDLILKCTDKKIHLLDDMDPSKELWRAVLELCKSLAIDALIDVGGAMAGTNNAQVAQELASMMKEGSKKIHRGVVYFNGRSETWHVFEIDNQRDVKLRSSSLTDSDCFVFYDESHCRGVDK
jgi:hypothetical protein